MLPPASTKTSTISSYLKEEEYYDPLQNFLYALKAPDSKRQYPRRLEYFFDYLGLKGTLKEKCLIYYKQAKNDLRWTQHQLMLYIEYQKERAEKGEIAESTINNYYKSIKLFCEMNDILLNWKKIAKDKPKHRDYSNDRAPTTVEIEKLLQFPEIVDIINRYFDFSFTGHSKLLFLNCDREVEREMINYMAILEMIFVLDKKVPIISIEVKELMLFLIVV
jgi:hypothetical protein